MNAKEKCFLKWFLNKGPFVQFDAIPFLEADKIEFVTLEI